jgi:hypothetical protein
LKQFRWMTGVIAACALVTGCAPHMNVSVAANVPAQYTHVWLTVRELWFNASDTATPQDTTWQKVLLDQPVTVDLASLTNAALEEIASKLNVAAGTYKQIRLLPVDETSALTSSASRAGARYNSEAEFNDASGAQHRVPLELLNPDKGIGIHASIRLKSGSTAGSRPPPVSVAVVFDGIHDLVRFDYGSGTGVLLNAHATAYDLSGVGAIQGTINLANIGTSISATGQVNVFVTAESISDDHLRHVAVATTRVATDGSFVLYPLPTDSSNPITYDVVIHGPNIATVIIKAVPVEAGDPSSSSTTSVGTIPARPAMSYAMNVKAGAQNAPGALIGLYQTPPQPGELPYLIEAVPLDPFSKTLFADQLLSTGTMDVGTYVAGGNYSLTTTTPVQGAGTYIISALAPLFKDGSLTTLVAPPVSGTSTVQATIGALKPAAGSDFSTLPVRVVAATPGKYDHGALMITHDGALIQAIAIDDALDQALGATFNVDDLPTGDDANHYYLSVRAWNSRDPSGTLQRQGIGTTADLRAGSIAGAVALIN